MVHGNRQLTRTGVDAVGARDWTAVYTAWDTFVHKQYAKVRQDLNAWHVKYHAQKSPAPPPRPTIVYFRKTISQMKSHYDAAKDRVTDRTARAFRKPEVAALTAELQACVPYSAATRTGLRRRPPAGQSPAPSHPHMVAVPPFHGLSATLQPQPLPTGVPSADAASVVPAAPAAAVVPVAAGHGPMPYPERLPAPLHNPYQADLDRLIKIYGADKRMKKPDACRTCGHLVQVGKYACNHDMRTSPPTCTTNPADYTDLTDRWKGWCRCADCQQILLPLHTRFNWNRPRRVPRQPTPPVAPIVVPSRSSRAATSVHVAPSLPLRSSLTSSAAVPTSRHNISISSEPPRTRSRSAQPAADPVDTVAANTLVALRSPQRTMAITGTSKKL
jgi:hypothetical protein